MQIGGASENRTATRISEISFAPAPKALAKEFNAPEWAVAVGIRLPGAAPEQTPINSTCVKSRSQCEQDGRRDQCFVLYGRGFYHPDTQDQGYRRDH